MPAHASVPTEEDVARAIVDAGFAIGTSSSRSGELRDARDIARAVLALFTPILAERENLACNLDAIQSDHADTLAMLIEANAERREFKARALAAEAALASAREALEPFNDALGEDDDGYPDDTKLTLSWRAHTDYSLTLGDLRRARAAAIRAQE